MNHSNIAGRRLRHTKLISVLRYCGTNTQDVVKLAITMIKNEKQGECFQLFGLWITESKIKDGNPFGISFIKLRQIKYRKLYQHID